MSQRTPSHAAPRSRRSRSGLLAGALTTTVVLGALAGVAFAFFQTSDSSNPAAASAASLSAVSPSATEVSSTSVSISWSNPGSQASGTEYVVQRTSPGVSTVCTTTGAGQLGNTSVADLCQDSGLSPGTAYSYSVTAKLGNWQSTPAPVSFTTMAVSISSPGSGTAFGSNLGGSTSGTSSAATGTTISNVKVSMQQGSGSCWTGSGNSWTAVCPNYVSTSGSVESWTLGLPTADLNSVNTYHVTAQATDSLSHAATTTSSFTYNTSGPIPAPPVASAGTHFTDGSGVYWVNSETVTLTDTVSYNGVGTVSSVAYYWCSTLSCGSANGTLIGSGSGPTWSLAWSSNLPPTDGTYFVAAVATDSLSNVGTSTSTKVGVDRTAPNVPTPSVNGIS